MHMELVDVEKEAEAAANKKKSGRLPDRMSKQEADKQKPFYEEVWKLIRNLGQWYFGRHHIQSFRVQNGDGNTISITILFLFDDIIVSIHAEGATLFAETLIREECERVKDEVTISELEPLEKLKVQEDLASKVTKKSRPISVQELRDFLKNRRLRLREIIWNNRVSMFPEEGAKKQEHRLDIDWKPVPVDAIIGRETYDCYDK